MEKGAKRVISLDVSGAFHCSLMDEASLRLKAEIDKVAFVEPRMPLISNVDAEEQTDPVAIKDNLLKQVNTATYWESSMRYLLGRGVDTYLEIGPGSVLKGLMKKIDPAAKVINIGKREDLQQLAGVLG
jgi:[acyl-carrier-protein] S-malonyltransferase